MYLTKLLLRDFGKFHNEEINLQPGINLIEGKEGSGKSTIREFITGIIYGMRKQSGENPNRRAYDSLRPEGRSRYSGTGYAKQGDQTYLIDRSFLAGAKKTSVLDVRTGREMNLKKPDSLYGTVLETDKNTYQDTYVIADTEGRARLTATQYMGERQDMRQNMAKHQKNVERFLTGAVRALLWCAARVIGLPVDEGAEIRVRFDDSYFTDTESQRERDLRELAAGVLSVEEYRKKWIGGEGCA